MGLITPRARASREMDGSEATKPRVVEPEGVANSPTAEHRVGASSDALGRHDGAHVPGSTEALRSKSGFVTASPDTSKEHKGKPHRGFP